MRQRIYNVLIAVVVLGSVVLAVDAKLSKPQFEAKFNQVRRLLDDGGNALLPTIGDLTDSLSLFTVYPDSGPIQGGNQVTILGVFLGSGNDIVSVTLNNVPAVIIEQTAVHVIVIAGSTTQGGRGAVRITSATRGAIVVQDAYRYSTSGTNPNTLVNPNSGPLGGGTVVSVIGHNLGSGTDIREVSIAGVSATITHQDEDTVTCITGVSYYPGRGDVIIYSDSRGVTTATGAFTYYGGNVPQPPPNPPPVDPPVEDITPNITSVNPDNGPISGANTVTIVGNNFGTSGAVLSVTIGGQFAIIKSQSATVIEVVVGGVTEATVADIVVITVNGNATLPQAYTFNTAGVIDTVDPSSGPIEGNLTVVISGVHLGNGDDITSVTVGGVQAIILSQTNVSVTVLIGGGLQAGAADVVVTSDSVGVSTKAAGFNFITEVTPPANDTTDKPAFMNAIVFKGKQYAVLDNTTANTLVIGCQSTPLELPFGWSLAPNNSDTRIALLGPRYRFGAECVVLEDGSSMNTITTADCGGGQLIKNGTFFSPFTCNRRILIVANASISDTWVSEYGVNRFSVINGKAFATIDNIDPSNDIISCQGTAVRLPTLGNWTLATAGTDTTAAITQSIFGTACMVFGDGSSVSHSGGACLPGNQLLKVDDYFAVLSCDQRILITSSVPVALPAGKAHNLRMKMLLIGESGNTTDELGLLVASRALESMEIPYDYFLWNPAANLTFPFLTGSLQSILNTSGDAPYYGFLVTRIQAVQLRRSEWLIFQDYCRTFHTRVVYMYSYPFASNGLKFALDTQFSLTPTTIQIHPDYASSPAFAGYNTNMTTDLSGVFRYPATVVDSSIATPVLEFAANGTVEGIAAAEINFFDGRRELHFFWDQANWMLTSAVLNSFYVQWATNGVYPGQRRILLSAQLDDLYLASEQWDPVTNTDTAPQYRITAEDVQLFADHVDQIRSQFPANSTVMAEWAFNGNGVSEDGGGFGKDAMFNKTLEIWNKFYWVTHGYTHLNFTETGEPPHQTTFNETFQEVLLNYQFAVNEFSTLPDFADRWSNFSMVTPGVFGLFNPLALDALSTFGFKYLIGENSRPELTPPLDTQYSCIRTSVAVNGFDGGLLIVPRFPTSVYYNAGLPEHLVAEFNFVNSRLLGRNLTLDEIMIFDIGNTVRNLLVLRHDPYMFHQANVRSFQWPDPETGLNVSTSLLGLWMRYLQITLNKYTTLPVLTEKFDTLGDRCTIRMSRRDCSGVLTMAVDADYKVQTITSSNPECKLMITGVRPANLAEVERVEEYGPDVTTYLGSGATFTLSESVDRIAG